MAKKDIKTPIKGKATPTKGKATPTPTPTKGKATPPTSTKKITPATPVSASKNVAKKVEQPVVAEKPKVDFSVFHKKNKKLPEGEDTRFNKMLYDPRFRDGVEDEEKSKIDVADDRFRISDNFFDERKFHFFIVTIFIYFT